MRKYGFFFDGTRCTACKTCVCACKDAHDLASSHSYRRVFEYTGGETLTNAAGTINTTCFTYSMSLGCNHCDNPVCVMVCPTGAMHVDPNTGLIVIDNTVCVGCGYCALSCPYKAPKVDDKKGHSVKCDGCSARAEKDEKPFCVLSCPTRALGFGLLEDMEKKGEQANIAPLPDKAHTMPHLYIKPSKDACPAGSRDGFIANPLEVK